MSAGSRSAPRTRDLARDLRGEEMRLAVGLEPGESRVRQPVRRGVGGDRGRGGGPPDPPLPDLAQPDRPAPRRGTREAAPEQVRIELERLEQEPADVGSDRADAHSGERLAKAGLERREQVRDRVVGGQLLGAARARRLDRELDREPRHRGRRASREGHRQRVDVEDVGRVDEDVGSAAKARVGERGVDGADGEDRRDRQARRLRTRDPTGRAAPCGRGRPGTAAIGEALEGELPVRRARPPDPRSRRAGRPCPGTRRAAPRGRRRPVGRGAASAPVGWPAAVRRAAPGAARGRPACP